MLLVVVLELEDDLLSDGAPIIISRKPIPSSSSLSLGKVTLAGAGAGALGGGTGMGGGPRLLPPLSLTPSAALESKGGAGGEAAGSITGWAASGEDGGCSWPGTAIRSVVFCLFLARCARVGWSLVGIIVSDTA